MMIVGQPGDEFFIIVDGEAEVLQRPNDDAPFEVVGKLGPSEYFGQLPILTIYFPANTVLI
jgi:cAMP-dependent protein kinase regulator